MNFQINDKVVCLDGAPGTGTILGQYEYPNGYIKQGQVYVVHRAGREESINEGWARDRLYLVGLESINKLHGRDFGWGSYRFRRLEEIQQQNALIKEEGQPV